MNKGPFFVRSLGRRLLWHRPALYRHFGLLRGRGDCLDYGFDLWIGGFPRSANTFALEAFRLANPDVRLVNPHHLPPFVVSSINQGKPGILLIREPEDSVISWAILWGGYLEESLDYYIDYHQALLRYLPRLFVATFEMVTHDFGGVIQEFNRRFGTQYATPPQGAEGEREIFSRIQTNSQLSGSELTVCRPSTERAKLKPELQRRLRQSPALIRKLEVANKLYAAFASAPLGASFPEDAPIHPKAPQFSRRTAPGAQSGTSLPPLAPRFSFSSMNEYGPRVMLSYLTFPLKRYILPVLFVGLALLSRLALEPVLHGRMPFSFFYVAIIVTAWTSGTSETFFSVLLGFFAAEYFIIEPVRSLAIVGARGWAGAATYFFVGLAIVWFIKSKRSAELTAISSAVEARRRLEEIERQHSHANELEQHLELVRAAVEVAPFALVCFSPEGILRLWNHAAQNLFGYSREEALGKTLSLLIPRDIGLQNQLTSRLPKDAADEPWEVELTRKDGSLVRVWLTFSPLSSAGGRALGVAVAARTSRG